MIKKVLKIEFYVTKILVVNLLGDVSGKLLENRAKNTSLIEILKIKSLGENRQNVLWRKLKLVNDVLKNEKAMMKSWVSIFSAF